MKTLGIRIKLWWLRKRVKALRRALTKADHLRDVLGARLGKLHERVLRLEERYRELRGIP